MELVSLYQSRDCSWFIYSLFTWKKKIKAPLLFLYNFWLAVEHYCIQDYIFNL